MESTEEYDVNPVSLTVDTLYLDWENDFPTIVFCERAHEIDEDRMNRYVFGRDSVIVREIVFLEGEMSTAVKCNDPSFDQSLCIMSNFSYYSNLLRKSCSEIFSYCSWNDKEFECCERFLPMYTFYGKCFAINSIASEPPTEKMLSFKFKDSPKLTVEIKTTLLSTSTLTAEDVISPRETLYGSIFEGFNKMIDPDMEFDVNIRFQNTINDDRVKTIPPDVRGCMFPEESQLMYSKVFSYPACVIDHIGTYQMKTCGCTQYLMPVAAREKHMCNNMSSLVCLAQSITQLVSEASRDKCPASCVESEIRVLSTLKRNVTVYNGKDSVSKINFYTHPPTLRYYRKVRRDDIELIVNIGGIGTLFFGASVLSLVEIIYYLLIYPCSTTTEKKANKKPGNEERRKMKKVEDKRSAPTIPGHNIYNFDNFEIRNRLTHRTPLPYIN
ncbi:PREDICTED: sodium channel protein Nach-like [Nicrophorus vespilloides]|uniref:Sodium channel protein Nach-like n=1 Tax=Nicrophorus vespilloides TaxID=110193 RepID=A0ABM1N1U4_NICVS|nr:PREDICTED: sodium channel protein Nach-like [Nicrophorus vespilloides]